MIEIGAALSSARALLNIATAAIEARDDAKLKAALIDLNSKLMDASLVALNTIGKSAELQAALHVAQREKADLQRQIDERSRYTLAKISEDREVFAYVSQPAQEGDDAPPHYLCQLCYDKGVKAVLQGGDFYGAKTYDCPNCKQSIGV